MKTILPLEIIKLSKQHPKEVLQGRLELHDNKLRVIIEFYCSEENDELGVWDKDIYRHLDFTVGKQHITGVRKYFTDNEKWKLTVYVNSIESDEIVFYSESEERINLLYTALDYWLYEQQPESKSESGRQQSCDNNSIQKPRRSFSEILATLQKIITGRFFHDRRARNAGRI